MKVYFLLRDDRRRKEGDLAREGFIYFFNCESPDENDLIELDEWCAENIGETVVYRGRFSEKFYRNIYVKSSQDAVLFRIRWC